ncbi:MAG: hypothetical protein M3Z46_09245 [Actinomycetota bacterium]|nr:hypothetical protein [Actinomycetota bacterium]
MRATPRAVATSLVVVVALFLAACEPTPTPPVARDRAAAWLVNEFGTRGVIPSSVDATQDDLAGTAYALTNLTASGAGRATARQAAEALATRADEYVVDSSGHDRPGALARLILAAEATGMDPRNFGGTNLVARLTATMRTTGPDRGLFGVQSPTYDGAFRQGLALAALSLVRPLPAVLGTGQASIEDAPPVTWLQAQQCRNGSWTPYRSDLSAPCAFDPARFTGPDTNSTALAVLGLQAVHATGAASAARWFTAVRMSDGGWSFSRDSAGPTDPDSTGLVLAALRSMGTPGDDRAVTRLLQFQFGPGAPGDERGAFWYPPFDDSPLAPNLQATNDALVGLVPGVWPKVVER